MGDKINDGGPAFPTCVVHWNNAMVDRGPGMSLRDWFAGQALAGLAGSRFYDRYVAAFGGDSDQPVCSVAASIAYEYADAMLSYRDIAAREGGDK